MLLPLTIMSARKINPPEAFPAEPSTPTSLRLDLSFGEVQIRKNGIEFRTGKPIPSWTEMTVTLETPGDGRQANFTGVVVACNGNRHQGYMVAMVFTGLTRQAQAQLDSFALSL
jgi:hypothetical protein